MAPCAASKREAAKPTRFGSLCAWLEAARTITWKPIPPDRRPTQLGGENEMEALHRENRSLTVHGKPSPGWHPVVQSNRSLITTTRHKAKGTAGTGRIGHGSATYQTANLCGKLNRASLPRPQGRAGAPNLGDDSGKYEDLGTTERPFGCPEITERRIRRRETRPRRMRSTSVS